MNPDLPDELINTHILPRLPVKSIGRCRSVSKPWRSFLSAPQFAKTHIKFHSDDPEDLIIEGVDTLRTLNFTDEGAVSRQVTFPFVENSWLVVVASCRGLVLLKSAFRFPKCLKFLILMNPITLESVEIPEYPHARTPAPAYYLGYDSCTDDYKIVSLSHSSGYDIYGRMVETMVDVYSVRMKCWRRIGPSPWPCQYAAKVFLNGCIHWLGVDTPTKGFCSLFIVSFDLAREKFEQIPFPCVVVDQRRAFEFWVLEGRLALMPDLDKRKGCIDIWVMEEYGVPDSWNKFTTINCPPNKDSEKPYLDCRVFCVLNEDEIVVINDSMQLLAYNWRNSSWRDMVVAGPPRGLESTSVAFKESLESPNHR